MTIHLRDYYNNSLTFRVKKTTKMGKVFRAHRAWLDEKRKIVEQSLETVAPLLRSDLRPSFVLSDKYYNAADDLCKSFANSGFAILLLTEKEREIFKRKAESDLKLFELSKHLKSQLKELTRVNPLKEMYTFSPVNDPDNKENIAVLNFMHETGQWLAKALGVAKHEGSHTEKEMLNIFDPYVEDTCFFSHTNVPQSKLVSFLYSPSEDKKDDETLDSSESSEDTSDDETLDSNKSGAKAHTDRGLLTIIYAPPNSGLEVRDAFGTWNAADSLVEEGDLIVLPGATIDEVLGTACASFHRVRLKEKKERHSIVYRMRSPLDANVFTIGPNKTIKDFNKAWEASHTSINEPDKNKENCNRMNEKGTKEIKGNFVESLEELRKKYERVDREELQNVELVKYCRRVEVLHDTRTSYNSDHRYFYNGYRVVDFKTPQILGLEDGDVIDAMKEACGD